MRPLTTWWDPPLPSPPASQGAMLVLTGSSHALLPCYFSLPPQPQVLWFGTSGTLWWRVTLTPRENSMQVKCRDFPWVSERRRADHVTMLKIQGSKVQPRGSMGSAGTVSLPTPCGIFGVCQLETLNLAEISTFPGKKFPQLKNSPEFIFFIVSHDFYLSLLYHLIQLCFLLCAKKL